jgi:ribosomal 30S subunit maturation factor RimM
MATIDSDLVGLHAFSSDGAKLGKVKRVLELRGRRYIEIGGFLSRELIVPAEGARKTTDERLELNYKNIYLDHAPVHKGKDEPTQEELDRVDRYYRSAA